ncbi:hypothetical protein SAMN05720764_12037 [Fibrobacter sp. UWH5]|nr:hypothetical protein [Fibrobacter sp. UWH5]SHL68083.1 hypothetical protein SAMN05720764_12037 [Fibrobacter sp. UWH5]
MNLACGIFAIALLNHRPVAFIGHNEIMLVKLEPILYGSVVHLGAEAGLLHQYV